MSGRPTGSRKSTKNKKKTQAVTPDDRGFGKEINKEILLLVILAVSILFLISNFGWGGLIGGALSSVLFGTFGWIAYLLPFLIFGVAAFLISNKGNPHAYIKTAALILFVFLLCAFLELTANQYQPGTLLMEYYRQAAKHKNAGGFVGGLLITVFCPLIGTAGTYVILIILAAVCIVLITERSLLKPLGKQSRRVYENARRRQKLSAAQAAKRREERDKERKEEYDRKMREFQMQDLSSQETDKPRRKKSSLSSQETMDLFIDLSEQPAEERKKRQRSKKAAVGQGGPAEMSGRRAQKPTEDTSIDIDMGTTAPSAESSYSFPPLELLAKGSGRRGSSDIHLRETALKLEETLQNFGVRVRVTNASCGPSVTRYELQPEQGVKVSRIVGLADDIKLNLAVTELRIEAPIPGKAAVGIEVPNDENTTVMLRDLLESPEFKRSTSPISFAVGKDIAGKTIVADIAKMPHLLVAGATGSGKSVCINTLIMSILFRSDPEDVKLIMVDPKVVELSVYNGIPHLLIPVVTDPRKAAGALNWAVAEMEKRYKLFAQYNVRDLRGFNEKILKMEPGDEVPRKMPQIVIIVDELADLMMVAPKDVENAICRLAQLARAAGIHLILATQRPSVNVITGLIKANMPSRIAFAVSSGVDSRTIIDMNGAEKLLGKGDMLFYPSGYPKPVRVQGSFVSDKEVQKVVSYLVEHNAGTAYSKEVEEQMKEDVRAIDSQGLSQEAEDDGRDPYFRDAGFLIIEKEKASIGMLQRMFKVGFNRAARIMDQLAEAGVVGPEEGTKPRKVLMKREEFEKYCVENENKQ